MTDNNTSTDYNSQSFPPFTAPVDMNGVLNALASLALLAFTVKLAETATVNNNASGASGAGIFFKGGVRCCELGGISLRYADKLIGMCLQVFAD